jgi:hypothetical protein
VASGKSMGTRSIVVSKGSHVVDLFEKAVCLTRDQTMYRVVSLIAVSSE